MSLFEYKEKKHPNPTNLRQMEWRDNFWLMNVVLQDNIPMWTGWNWLITEDHLPQQILGYMENLNMPPTRLDVVAETLPQSQRVAAECGEEYAIVTYDLAVAKPALQIQAVEYPLYDNIYDKPIVNNYTIKYV